MKVIYRSIDGYRVARSFKTLKGARAFAHKWVGETPEIGSSYAISGDGVGKVTLEGCTFAEVFLGCTLLDKIDAIAQGSR